MEDNNLKLILFCLLISVTCLWIMATSQKTEIAMLRSAFLHFVNCSKCQKKNLHKTDKKETEVKE